MPYLASRYFGFRSFGEIYGILFASFTMGVAAGPPLMGMGFDRTGGYGLPLGVMLGMLAVAVVGAALLPQFADGVNAVVVEGVKKNVELTGGKSRSVRL